jgi:hypothetical protein
MTVIEQLLVNAIPYIIPGAVAAGGTWLIMTLRKNPKTAPLAAGVLAAEDALDAAAKAAPGGPKAALTAAEEAIKADKGELVDAAKAEIDALAGTMAPTSAVTPSGASVNLPKVN